MVEELDQIDQVETDEPPKKTKVLYDAVSKDYDLGSYEDFEKKLQNSSKRKAFYEGVGSKYDLGTFQEFENKVAPVKKKELSTYLGGQSNVPSDSQIPTVDLERPKNNFITGVLDGIKEKAEVEGKPQSFVQHMIETVKRGKQKMDEDADPVLKNQKAQVTVKNDLGIDQNIDLTNPATSVGLSMSYTSKKLELEKKLSDLHDIGQLMVERDGVDVVKNPQFQKLQEDLQSLNKQKQQLSDNVGFLLGQQLAKNPAIDNKEIGKQVRETLQPENKNAIEKMWGDKLLTKEQVESRDFNDELTGISAKQDVVVNDFHNGKIGEQEAHAALNDLSTQYNTLEKKYPTVAVDALRNIIGDRIASYRKENDNIAQKLWHNVVVSEAGPFEIKGAIEELRKSGVEITPEQEKQIFETREKIPLTSMVGNFYHNLILNPANKLNNLFKSPFSPSTDNSEREKEFRNTNELAPVQGGEQAQIVDIGDGKKTVRMGANPEANKGADILSWGTLNNVAQTAGTIGAYITANRVLGGGIGALGAGKTATNILGNISASMFLNYDDYKKSAQQQGANEGIQDIYAFGRSIVDGLLFSEFSLNKIKNVAPAVEKKITDDFLTKFANGSFDKSKFADWVVNTSKDLGKNVSIIKAQQLSGIVADKILNPQENQGRNIMDELMHNIPADVISLLPFSAISGYHSAGNKKAQVRQAITMATADPIHFAERMHELVNEGKIDENDAKAKIDYVTKLAEKANSADLKTPKANNLTTDQRQDYAHSLVNEATIKQQGEGLTDAVQKTDVTDNIKKEQDFRKNMLLQSEIGDKHFKDLSDEEKNKIPVPETQKVKTQPSGTEGKFTPVIIDEKGDHTVLNKSFDTPEAAKIYGENKLKEKYFDENISTKQKEKTLIDEKVQTEISVEQPMAVPEPVQLVDKKEIINEPATTDQVTKENTISTQPVASKETITTETEPIESVPEATAAEDGDKKGITHAAVAELRKIIDLPEYEGKPVETHEALISEAKEVIKNNPNAANEALDKIENDKEVTNKDNAVLAIYKATLDAELAKSPSKELLERATRLAKALDVSGTKAGKLLESRKLVADEDNLTNFLLQKQASQGTALTETQVKSEAAKYEELKTAKEALEKQLVAEREQHAKDIAELGLNKAKAKAKKDAKKSDADYKAERKSAIDAAREALKKLRTGEGGLQATIPLVSELRAIAPHVKDFLNSLASQGIDKLDNAITAIHAEFKDVLEGLSKKDVLDILAGEHDEKKEPTRNEKANTVRLLKREAQLLKDLERERKGEQKAKTEKEKIPINRRIDELKEKIAEVRRLNKNRGIDHESPEDATAGEIEYNAQLQKTLIEKAQKLTRDIRDKKHLEEKTQPVLRKSRKTHLLEDKVIDLENKIRHERAKDEYEKRSNARKVFDKVMEVLGVRRLVQSAVDISVPFRQGATLISPRRIDVWAKGFKANMQSIFSPKKFERIMSAIRKDPQYHEMTKDGIVFNDLGAADPDLHNEDFRKSFIYDIPIISEPLKASNRSADAFLNVARYDMYKKMRQKLEQQGLTRESDPEAFKYAGNFVMSMTGRGKMMSMFENRAANTVLGNTFYGARLMASRFNLLNPYRYFDPKIPKEAKREAMKDMAAFTVTTMAMGLGLAAAGGKISLNPDDSDFLQIRFGDKVYDISGGLANYVRTFLRIAKAGYTKATESTYEGNQAVKKAGESTLNFFRNKLSPNTAYGVDAFFGGRYGQKFDPYDIIRIYPMYTEDVLKSLKEEGLMAIPTVLLPNILGIGYGSYASKGQIDKNLEDLQKRNERTEEMNNENIKNWNAGGRKITDDETDTYIKKRDAAIDKDLKVFYEKGINGVPYKDLTPDQVKDETTYIKANATREVKKELFGERKLTHKEKRDQEKLSKQRKKEYKNN